MEIRKSPVSKSIILIPLTLIIVFTLVGFWLIYLHFNRTSINKFEQNLLNLAQSGARMIHLVDPWGDIRTMDYYTDKFAQNSMFRATIIDDDGTVLGDSRLSIDEIMEIENLGSCPEILDAKESGTGISIRHSTTIEQDLVYVAVRFNRPGMRKAYFRVAMPLMELKKELIAQRFVLWGFCFVALAVACFLSILASRYLLSLVKKGEFYLEETVLKRTKTIEMLQNLATQLTACNSSDESLEVIKLIASKLLPKYTGTLALFRASKDRLEIAKSWNGEWDGENTYSPDQCWALRTGRSHIGSQDSGNMICTHSLNLEGKMLCFPLIAQGETHGVLHFYSQEDTEWTEAEHRQALAISEHTSLALANLRLRESLRQQAIRDPLTGLYNRRYLHETMDQEISRAERHKQNIGVLMLDLDKFKKFNDEHGHEIGDFILSEFGRLIRTVIRNEDIACRYGGEEFTVLLPESDPDSVKAIAERIRIKVRDHVFLHENHSYGPITVSIGASSYPDNGKTAGLLIKNADDALYRAKQAGRDQVVFASLPD
ncbi:MAG: diguanylate cyclase [Desulfobacteraceae bacterium]|jgi:diguanylate cyclase (GGDEF)-like protein